MKGFFFAYESVGGEADGVLECQQADMLPDVALVHVVSAGPGIRVQSLMHHILELILHEKCR